jgi:hypothetical protein
MSGGLMQLVAYGAQDIYLTGSPKITFFKVVYRRHTNFAIESIEQTVTGTANFGQKITCTIARNGDLMHRVYLQLDLPAITSPSLSFRWIDDVGNFIIKNTIFEVGGQEIDKHYGDWLYVWNQLTQEAGKVSGYKDMIGQTVDLTSFDTDSKSATTLYIPLQFYFCRNVGLALPLIALQYHEVKIKVEFRSAAECYIYAGTYGSTLTLSNVSLWVDYIYLDTLERRRFAQNAHEYLVEQLQYQEENASASTERVRLNFNHPIKELIWTIQSATNVAAPAVGNDWIGYQWSNYSADAETNDDDWTSTRAESTNPCTYGLLQLNGQNRFARRKGNYFNTVQPYQHHTNIPASPGINVYSFALKPEEHQPSGTCNFSRIDNATLTLYINASIYSNATIRIYASNYNVFRVVSGMGGLAYSA